jgi:hypothetical protein
MQYLNSKLMNVLFAKEYARRCPHPIWICSANPGHTESELGLKDPVTGERTGNSRPKIAKMRCVMGGGGGEGGVGGMPLFVLDGRIGLTNCYVTGVPMTEPKQSSSAQSRQMWQRAVHIIPICKILPHDHQYKAK